MCPHPAHVTGHDAAPGSDRRARHAALSLRRANSRCALVATGDASTRRRARCACPAVPITSLPADREQPDGSIQHHIRDDRRVAAIASGRVPSAGSATPLPASVPGAVALPGVRIRHVDWYIRGDHFAPQDGAVVRLKGNPVIACAPQLHRTRTLFNARREACHSTFLSLYGRCFKGVCCSCPVRRAGTQPARQAQMRLMGCDKAVPRWTAPV